LKENLLANPDDQPSRMLLAAAHERAGKSRLAVATYNEALDHSPHDVRILVPVAAALHRAREYERVDDLLQQAADQGLFHPQLKQLELGSHLRQGQLSSAGDILEDLIAEDPNNPSHGLILALIRMRQGDLSEARRLLDTLSAREPNSIPVHKALIELSLRQGNSEEALRMCDRIASTADNASARTLRAQTYAALGRTEEAEKEYIKAGQSEPNNVGVWLAMSSFYQSIGDKPKALKSIREALALQPDNLAVLKRAVPFLLASDEPATRNEGRRTLDRALASTPQGHDPDPELRLYKARLLAAKGTAPAARQATGIIEKLTENQPRFPQAWATLAELSLNSGLPGRAIDVALRGLAYAPNDKQLLLLKARAEAARSPALAVPTLMLLRDMEPNDAEVAIRLSNMYLAADDPEKAVVLLQQQLPRCDDSSRRDCRIALAVALYKNGQEQQARQEFDSLLEAESNDLRLLATHVQVLTEDKRWDELTNKLNNWYQKQIIDSEKVLTIARQLTSMPDPAAHEVAERLLRGVLKDHPDSVTAITLLAMLLQKTDRHDEAAGLYQKILQLEPTNPIAINNLAWILCEEQGKPEQALELAQRGLENNPNYIDLLDTHGVILHRLKRYSEALDEFKKCAALYLPNAPALSSTHFHLAKTQMQLGQNDDALKSLRKARELNSKNRGLSAANAAEIETLIEQLREVSDHVPTTTGANKS
jgi:Tfp pilus assembly protein PilF